MPSASTRSLPRGLSRNLLRKLGWLAGAPLAIFRFLRRQTPLEEDHSEGVSSLAPVTDPPGEHRADAHGVGPVVNRLYSATIQAPKLTAERLVAIIAADPNVIAPTEVLRFEKTQGRSNTLQEGDQLIVRMAGPWNAPLAVTRRWETGFRFTATRGHPQLGEIEFRARDEHDQVTVEIQTRERAAGLSFHILQRIRLIRRMQSYTWGEMLENTAQLAGGRRLKRITVRSWPQQ